LKGKFVGDRENMDFTLWEIKRKIQLLEASTSTTTSLPQCIAVGKSMREIKKVFQNLFVDLVLFVS
jgi:hypothetical protein